MRQRGYYFFDNLSISNTISINDNLMMYLSYGGELSPDGGGSPFSVVSRRMMINPVNIKICI